jgi:hypothetical protein
MYLILTVGWVASIFYGPVVIVEYGDETVYTHNYLLRFLFVGAALLIGSWLAIQHLRAYGLRRTFRTDYNKWDAAMRDSAIGLSIFAFGLVFVALTIWGYSQADYFAVSPAGIREGSGTYALGMPQIRFQELKSIDLNHRDTTETRRGRCLRFIGPGDQERLITRKSLVNAAIPKIVEEATKHHVQLLNQ